MAKKFLIAFVAVNVIGFLIYFIVSANNHRIKGYDLYEHQAGELESLGAMKSSTYMRMATIYEASTQTKKVSDADIDYIFAAMDHPIANTDTAIWQAEINGCIFLQSLPYTQAQADRVYQHIEPLLKSRFLIVRLYAVRLYGPLGDKRIVPELLPLLHDPDPGVVKMDHKVLAQLGYTA